MPRETTRPSPSAGDFHVGPEDRVVALHAAAIGNEIRLRGRRQVLELHGNGRGLVGAGARLGPGAHRAGGVEQRQHGAFVHAAREVGVALGEGHDQPRGAAGHVLDAMPRLPMNGTLPMWGPIGPGSLSP